MGSRQKIPSSVSDVWPNGEVQYYYTERLSGNFFNEALIIQYEMHVNYNMNVLRFQAFDKRD